MDWWTGIRLEVLRGESKKREILRREGIHWETLKKILAHPFYAFSGSIQVPVFTLILCD